MAGPTCAVDRSDVIENLDVLMTAEIYCICEGRLSLSYKCRPVDSASQKLRPEGLGAAMQRVLDFQGRLLREPPLFLASRFFGGLKAGFV